MIVHTPTLTKAAGEICIAARFEMRKPLPHTPNELWYRFPDNYEARLSPRADGFAATALLLAMYAGEDLSVRGPISPRLAYSLYEYRTIFHTWLPKMFQVVDIQFDQISAAPPIEGEGAVATAFSGGVDSFYTLWTHLAENQAIPEHRLTHGLFMHGLDLRLGDEATYLAVADQFKTLFKRLGLELIQATTNARQFSEFRIDWTLFHGPPLIGAALLMSPFLRRFYVPSFVSYLEIEPQGTSPLTDHLLSTETLEIVHQGASVKRMDKLSVLVDWPVTYDHMRVCPGKRGGQGVQNCSACHKCYRTMVSLSLLDALPRYRTFSGKLTVGSYFRWGLFKLLNIGQAAEIRNRAVKSGRFGMALLIQIAMILQFVRKTSVKLVTSVLSREQMYRIKRKIYQPASDELREGK